MSRQDDSYVVTLGGSALSERDSAVSSRVSTVRRVLVGFFGDVVGKEHSEPGHDHLHLGAMRNRHFFDRGDL